MNKIKLSSWYSNTRYTRAKEKKTQKRNKNTAEKKRIRLFKSSIDRESKTKSSQTNLSNRRNKT